MIGKHQLSNLRAAIGGKWLASFKIFLFFAPIWLLISLLITPQINFRSFSFTTIANISGLLICAVVLLLFRVSLFRNREHKPVPIVVVLLTGAFLGVVKSFSTQYILQLLDPSTSHLHEVSYKLFGAAFIGMWALPLAALIMSTKEKFQLEREFLIAQLVQSKINRGIISNVGAEWSSNISKKSKSNIQGLISTTREMITNGQLSQQVSPQQWKRLIDTQLKPLSKLIWEETDAKQTKFTLKDLLTITIKEHNFNTWMVISAYSLSTLPLLLSFAPGTEAVLRLLCQIVPIWICFTIGRKIHTETMVGANIVFWGTLALAIGASYIIPAFLFGTVQYWNQFAVFSATLLSLIFNTLIFGIGSSAFEEHQIIRSKIQDLLTEEDIDKEVLTNATKLENKEIANYIHGQIQNSLTILSMPSEPLHKDFARTRLLQELDELERLLKSGTVIPDGAMTENVYSAMDRIESSWKGIISMNITISLSSQHAFTEKLHNLIAISNESIGNAVRHGIASEVSIFISETQAGSMRFICLDNGTGPRKGIAGLGTTLYSSIATNSWSLHQREDGIGSELIIEF